MLSWWMHGIIDPFKLLGIAVASILIIVLRFIQVIRSTHSQQQPQQYGQHHVRRRPPGQPSKMLVFLGSGGHTGEMLRLLIAVDFQKYSQRTYLVSSGDSLSLAKVAELETARAGDNSDDSIAVRCSDRSYNKVILAHTSCACLSKWTAFEIPRARRVHQSFLTAPFTTLRSFAVCLRLVTLPCILLKRDCPDIVLLNGPGSCVPIAIAAFLPRVCIAAVFS
jgi:beta-1,4-N-acetylglucosaminyltransferase